MRISPTASTGALADVLSRWMDARGSRDLVGLLEPLRLPHCWGKAPKISLLSDYTDLACMLLEKAPLCKLI